MDLTIRDDLHPEISAFVDVNQFNSDVHFDPTDFGNDYIEQAPLQAYYGELRARAAHQAHAAKDLLGVVEAQVAKALRQRYEATGIKATEARLSSEVSLDTSLLDAQWKLRDAKYVQGLVETAYNAMDAKRWTLKAYADLVKGESQGPMRMYDQSQHYTQ
jgi:hypothetical protein